MRLHHTSIALALIAALSAGTTGQNKTPDAMPARESAATKVANPMASFARMVGGEWRRPALTKIDMFETWHWGPGKHSMLAQTYGTGIDSEPVRSLEIYYWHPGRKQICLLVLSPYFRGVSEGTIKFEGETAEAVFDLHQSGLDPLRNFSHRKMGLRWTFSGPDKYNSLLLESTGRTTLERVFEWDYVRFKTLTPKPATAEEAKKPSDHLKAFESFLGHTWEAKGEWRGAAGDAFHIQSTFEWVPYANAIHSRVIAPTKGGESTHLLDAYFYHHTGFNALRCLALSNKGGVYEGDVTVLDGGALQLDLKGYEGDRFVPHVVRFDFEQDGTPHHRVWSLKGTERTLMLDVYLKKLVLKKD